MCSAPIGNKNAKKDKTLTKKVTIRCSIEEIKTWRARVRKLNKNRDVNGVTYRECLSDWIRFTLNSEVGVRNLTIKRCVDVRKKRMQEARILGTHTNEEWENIKKLCNYKCLRCGKREPIIKLSKDHIIPVSQGGGDGINNIQPLCMVCNIRKSCN